MCTSHIRTGSSDKVMPKGKLEGKKFEDRAGDRTFW